jgi:hypothetical protein
MYTQKTTCDTIYRSNARDIPVAQRLSHSGTFARIITDLTIGVSGFVGKNIALPCVSDFVQRPGGTTSNDDCYGR